MRQPDQMNDTTVKSQPELIISDTDTHISFAQALETISGNSHRVFHVDRAPANFGVRHIYIDDHIGCQHLISLGQRLQARGKISGWPQNTL